MRRLCSKSCKRCFENFKGGPNAKFCPECSPVIKRENASRREIKYRLAHPDRVKVSRNIYRSSFLGKTTARKYSRKRHKNFREELNLQSRIYHATHREDVNNRKRRWNGLNRNRLAKYARTRRKEDPQFRLVGALRCRIRLALKGVGKSAHTMELLGCPIRELRVRLEKQFRPGMTWENYGPVWHVDHIKPCISFDLTNPGEQRRCFHFTNLQPLFARDNLAKGSRWAEAKVLTS